MLNYHQLSRLLLLLLLSFVLISTAQAHSAQAQQNPLPASALAQQTTVAENPYWWWSLAQVFDDGNWEIYLRRYNQQNQPEVMRLTNHPAADVEAQFNYGAERIVFVSDRDTTTPQVKNTEIYLMDADGANLRRLTNNPARDEMPAWSPTGHKIAWASAQNDSMEIYTMNSDGSGVQRLTYLAGEDTYPTWSPDGQMLAWVRQGAKTGELWLMNADGSNQHRLSEPLRYLSRPLWSPDGRYLVFSYFPNSKDLGRIGLIQRDGANLHELACDMADVYEDRTVGGWSPDGSTLYYNRYNYNQKGQLLWTQVWAMSIIDGNCTFGGGDQWNERRFKVFTALVSADPWPPTSSLQPVPPYSRLPNLLVALTGKDQGRSGIAYYTVQYRPSYNLAWLEGSSGGALLNLDNLSAGKIFLRSRAVDQANHEEAWPSSNEGEASTLMYRWLIQGRLTDQRGVPLAQQSLLLNPAAIEERTTTDDGVFLLRVGDGERFLLNNTMGLAAGQDWTRPLYQAPTANLLRNGDFEAAALTDWHSSGAPAPQLTKQPSYNGQQVLRLGATCTGDCVPTLPDLFMPCQPNSTPGCLQPPGTTLPYNLRPVTLFTDAANNLHFFGRSDQDELIYQHGRPDAAWDASTKLADHAIIHTAALEKNGTLHAVWGSTMNDGALFYGKRTASGNWEETQLIGSGLAAELALDSQNRPHLFYLGNNPYPSNQQSLHYRSMLPSGVWSEPLDLATYPFSSNLLTTVYHDIVITPDDRVHLVWGKPEMADGTSLYRLVHKVRETNGSWQPETTIALSAVLEKVELFSSVQGDLHLFWIQNGIGFYATKPVNDPWSAAEAIGRFTFVTQDAADTLHLFEPPHWNVPGAYRYKAPNQRWSDSLPISAPAPTPYLMAIRAGAANTIHALWSRDISSTPNYEPTARVTTTTDSQIQQVVTIPATMHRPTFSFIYALDGGVTGASHLAVTVQQEVTTTQVFSATQPTPWTLGWVDMTPWQGKTITLTIKLHQAATDLRTRAYLDELALTAWQTAVPHTFAPQQVDVGVAATLVISGENFIPMPTIKVEETLLTNVQQLDDQTVGADLPATLSPGRYRLWLTNPGNTVSSYIGQLQVGKPLFLPVIAR